MMKRTVISLSAFLLICCSAHHLHGQENTFRSLAGMEDEDGNTHLFYELKEPFEKRCSNYSPNEEIYEAYRLNLYHLDIRSGSDTVLIENRSSVDDFCNFDHTMLEDLEFQGANPSRFIQLKTENFGTTESNKNIYHNGSALSLTWMEIPKHIEVDESQGDLFFPFHDGSYRVSLSDDLWGGDNLTAGEFIPDRAEDLGYWLIGINPEQDGHYVGVDDEGLLVSYDAGKTILRSTEELGIGKLYVSEPLFTEDSTLIYISEIARSPRLIRLRTRSNRLIADTLFSGTAELRITKDVGGELYFSEGVQIYVSQDYGETIDPLITFEQEVTGLYKKPESDRLYIATTDELFLYTNGELQSLKKRPVSISETGDSDLPSEIALEQNYPNPFNPSTTITFQLSEASKVMLEVFDITGRQVTELVNERLRAGEHAVSFDAANLASGIYLYRLTTPNVTQTRKMVLVK